MMDDVKATELMDEHHQDAMKTLRAEEIRHVLEMQIFQLAKDIVYDAEQGLPENYREYLEYRSKRLLEDMFMACPPEAWELIGKPIMDEHYAKQFHNMQMSRLLTEAMTNPVELPESIRAALKALEERADP